MPVATLPPSVASSASLAALKENTAATLSRSQALMLRVGSTRARARLLMDTSQSLRQSAPRPVASLRRLDLWPAAGGIGPTPRSTPSEMPTAARVEESRPSAQAPELHRLVIEHLAMAERLARRLTPGGYPNEDFAQVARLALVEATRRYEPERGVPFPAYASAVIIGHLKHYLRDRCWAVRPPRRLQELWLTAGPARERLSQQLGRGPSTEELARELGVSQESLVEALEAKNGWSTDSFDQLAQDDGPAWEPAVVEARFDLIDDRSWLGPALAALPERLKRVIELRFVHELTQRQIAEEIGVSQMHVSRLLARALSELRAAAA